MLLLQNVPERNQHYISTKGLEQTVAAERKVPCKTNKWREVVLPRASCRYFCPTSLRYSSMALVASVFSRKMRCSFSPQRSTSDIIRSVRKSCQLRGTTRYLEANRLDRQVLLIIVIFLAASLIHIIGGVLVCVKKKCG